MVTTHTKWFIYQDRDTRGWVAQAPNGDETEHPSHATALNHVAADQRRRTILTTLILALLETRHTTIPHPLPQPAWVTPLPS